MKAMYKLLYNLHFIFFRFTRDVICPDPSKAPPRPTTTTSTKSTKITSTSTTPSVITTASTSHWFMDTSSELPVTTKRFIPEGVVLTAIAGKYAERPSMFIAASSKLYL